MYQKLTPMFGGKNLTQVVMPQDGDISPRDWTEQRLSQNYRVRAGATCNMNSSPNETYKDGHC
jgi:hypothetical protein